MNWWLTLILGSEIIFGFGAGFFIVIFIDGVRGSCIFWLFIFLSSLGFWMWDRLAVIVWRNIVYGLGRLRGSVCRKGC